jgi:hypothetical protein
MRFMSHGIEAMVLLEASSEERKRASGVLVMVMEMRGEVSGFRGKEMS